MKTSEFVSPCDLPLMELMESSPSHRIVFRNLKPSKCAFNIRGDIVLSDMGLARDTRGVSKVTDETFKLTGSTGSLRFMAPEVALNEPYGFSADMHSFGLTLWQMLKAEEPFDALTSRKTFVDLVVKKGARPKIEDTWGGPLVDVLKSCWHCDLTKRPTATQCLSTLRQELIKFVKDKNNKSRLFSESSLETTIISQEFSLSDGVSGATLRA